LNPNARLFISVLLAAAAALLTACATAGPAGGVDESRLISDVQALTTPEMAGRATGSPGGKLARAYVAKRFSEIGLTPLGKDFVHPFSFTLRNGKKYDDAANVIGALRGTADPERWLVVSAHYDHLGEVNGQVYPGADDNASGVAAILAVAAHFKAHPPKHSVMFVSFDAEELGLRGAREFTDKPPVPLEKIAAVMNLDMLSASATNEIYMAGTHHRSWLKPYIDEAAMRAKVKVLFGHDQPATMSKLQDWTISSDHGPLHMKGIPFVYFGVEDHPAYHQPTDTFANFNRAFFTRVAPLFVDVATVLDRELSEIAKKAGR
jgi:Zn-dependent M28 family amino/carboxypeptidase